MNYYLISGIGLKFALLSYNEMNLKKTKKLQSERDVEAVF